MATALAPEKPLLGQKMPWPGSRLENRPVSRRMHREKCRPRLRLASGAPVFANGATSAAFAFAFSNMASNQDDQGAAFDLDTTEGRQEAANWLWENRETLGIEVSEGATFEYVDDHMMWTPIGRVACDGPCQVDNVRTFEMGGEYFRQQNAIRLYRGAFTPTRSASIQPPGGNPTIIAIPNMTPMGSAAWALGHEAAHSRGIEVGGTFYPHLRSEYHGYQAYRRFRELRGN